MTQHPHVTASNGLNYDRTLILAVEVSGRSGVVAAQVPGLRQKGAKQQLAPRADALMAAVEGSKRRAAAAGMAVDRVIIAYESGGSGFWLARWLQQRGVEVHVMQPSSVPVDRRMRRAKSDRIDADISGWSKMLARLHQQSGTTGWALHDLRRSAATRMQDLGTPQETVSRILNHAVGGVDSVYLRGHVEEKKRLALGAWSAELTRLTSMDEESCKALNETCAEILSVPQRSSR